MLLSELENSKIHTHHEKHNHLLQQSSQSTFEKTRFQLDKSEM